MDEIDLYRYRKRIARFAGLFYLILAMAMFPEMLRNTIIVSGNTVLTMRNLITHRFIFRLSIFGDMLFQVAFVFLICCLYALLKDVRKNVALVMMILSVLSIAIEMVLLSSELVAVNIAMGIDQNLAMSFLEFYKSGTMVVSIFFGLWLAPLGWLFFKSDFMPKTLGLLLMIGSSGYIIDSFVGIVFPGQRSSVAIGILISATAELSTVFWLLVCGVKKPRDAKK
jgi:hypothetical protein